MKLLKSCILSVFEKCHELRLQSESVHLLAGVARIDGYLIALLDTDQIVIGEYKLLFKLLNNAFDNARCPFPDRRNVGPVMPSWVALQRQLENGRAANDSKPEQVSTPRPCPELRLLCMLDTGRNCKARTLPVHTLQRLQAPWAAVPRKWSLVLPDGLQMRETHAQQPTAEVLERYLRLGQAGALRPNMGLNQ